MKTIKFETKQVGDNVSVLTLHQVYVPIIILSAEYLMPF